MILAGYLNEYNTIPLASMIWFKPTTSLLLVAVVARHSVPLILSALCLSEYHEGMAISVQTREAAQMPETPYMLMDSHSTVLLIKNKKSDSLAKTGFLLREQ